MPWTKVASAEGNYFGTNSIYTCIYHTFENQAPRNTVFLTLMCNSLTSEVLYPTVNVNFIYFILKRLLNPFTILFLREGFLGIHTEFPDTNGLASSLHIVFGFSSVANQLVMMTPIASDMIFSASRDTVFKVMSVFLCSCFLH